jgi:tetraacyldisaccharide 4'-kinase
VSARIDLAVLAHRMWSGEGRWAPALAAVLLVPSAGYRAAVALRNAAYALGLRRSRTLPRPSIGTGNLAVGGTGKTPLAAHFARELVRRGARPGILLRGYGGGDEAAEHAERVPEAVVVADADRIRGATRAVAEGADVLVLDDCLQHRKVRPDVLLAVVAAEAAGSRMRRLPAGPWREGLAALGRCDGVVVTFRTAASETAAELARRLAPRTRARLGVAAELGLARFLPLGADGPLPPAALSGRRVVAVCAIGTPELFRAQLEALGARVQLLAFGDHHAYSAADVVAAAALAGPDGLVVTTGKDAVKLRPIWGADGPACLVAEVDVRVTYGHEALGGLLDRAVSSRSHSLAAEAPPSAGQTPL